MEIMRVEGLVKHFPILGGILQRTIGYVYAVNDVSFTVREGETYGLVGESGSGKTTVGRIIVKLLDPTSGKIFFDRSDVTSVKGDGLKTYRKKVQMVFQDPYASMNPRMTVKSMLMEVMKTHSINKGSEYEQAVKLMERVGMSEEHLYRYPHELSGGQRQRVVIARALSVDPKFIVLDEPTASLDVSVQAQVIDLLKELQEKYGHSYLLITHNLAIIKYISHHTTVMYRGVWVESSPTVELFNNPQHPYTIALMAAVPVPDPSFKKSRIILKGEPPNPIDPVKACPFQDRCPYVMEICREKTPPDTDLGKEHMVRCWLRK
ncbi:MAG: ABC transporter ATP-binding protein [Nitrososphaeria archaeon]